jgi:hypothetical protein
MGRLTSVLVASAVADAVLWRPAIAAGGPSTTVLRQDGIPAVAVRE